MSDPTSTIQSRLHEGERLILLTDSDMTRDCRFGRTWLAVTNERVMAFGDGRTADAPDAEVLLKSVREVRTAHMVGHAALEAEADGRKVELLRFSNALSDRFGRVARSLDDACKGGRAPEFDLREEERRSCPKCGRLLPEKGSFCPSCLKKREVVGRLWGYVQPHWHRLALVVGLIILGAGLSVIPPYLVKLLVDRVFRGDGGRELLLMLVGALVVIQLAATGIEMVRGRTSAWLSSAVMHELRFDLYQAIQRLSLRRHDKTQTGSLLSRLTGDTSMLNWMLIDAASWFLPNMLLLIGICVMLFVMNWWLALLVLVPTPAVAVLTTWLYGRLSRLYFRWYQRYARMSAQATDSISGIRVVKAFGQEAEEIGRFGRRSEDLYRSTAAAESMWATAAPLLGFITASGSFLVWYFGGLGVLEGSVTIGTLVAYVSYLLMFYGPVQMMTRFSDFVNRGLTAAQRLFEITDAEQEAYDDADAKHLDEVQGAFGFEDVQFSYLKDTAVLKGLSVQVEPGEMIGLVGRSGAGKTTITNLICRFYDVDEGAIKLDGLDLRKVRLRDLRRHIGIVPQESFLFNGSVAENIAYARPGATRQQVMEAATAANAHGFIMRLPDGYDTRVGERGARLSGGEKQRIAIARAILHDPRVLILDEATSSVDTETEELIQQALARLVKGRTTFAIAHRLSTLRNASRLLVLEDGKVAEVGTHDELVAKGGIYARLVEMQSRLSSLRGVDG
jgi:ATP-binding cassette subfamily B protein